MRAEVLEIVQRHGKMHNPVTGSGGMLVGTVEEVGEGSPLGLATGDRIATLVSLTLTPLVIEDGLADWDGRSEQVPADGYAILFGRSIAAKLPDDLPANAGPVGDGRMWRASPDGAPCQRGTPTRWSPSSVAPASPARSAWPRPVAPGRGRTLAVVPHQAEADLLGDGGPGAGLADQVLVCDARDPVALRDAVTAAGGPADLTIVCVDVPGCEGGAILSTADGGTVIFFSMATSFSAAALGAEGLAADVTMVVGNGYVPGHADLALEILRSVPAVRALFERRL